MYKQYGYYSLKIQQMIVLSQLQFNFNILLNLICIISIQQSLSIKFIHLSSLTHQNHQPINIKISQFYHHYLILLFQSFTFQQKHSKHIFIIKSINPIFPSYIQILFITPKFYLYFHLYYYQNLFKIMGQKQYINSNKSFQKTQIQPSLISHSPIIIKQNQKKLHSQSSQNIVKNQLRTDNKNKMNYKNILTQSICVIVPFGPQSNKKQNNLMKQKRIMHEIKNFKSNLPCDQTNSIFIIANQKNISRMRGLIFGAEDTPYEHGAFIFDITLNSQYPIKPPNVVLMTTGKQTIRFNPNLYNNGYVCLSILGTWRGTSYEQWSPASSISKVLISIQSMVMTNDVYFNEPGIIKDANNQHLQHLNNGYSNIVRLGNIRFCMNQMLQGLNDECKQFFRVIKTHFYLKKQKILSSVLRWIQKSKEQIAQYTNLVYNHNQIYASKFKSKNYYQQQLKFQFDRLKRNLQNIKLEDTLIKNLKPQEIESKNIQKKQEKQT